MVCLYDRNSEIHIQVVQKWKDRIEDAQTTIYKENASFWEKSDSRIQLCIACFYNSTHFSTLFSILIS